ncbi:MAG TPA: hypothetical protein VJS64_04075 [Pyrinomonadaceae bacterium]|nr:hypothetical protein [Pyrinomonadaceae bacterium]
MARSLQIDERESILLKYNTTDTRSMASVQGRFSLIVEMVGVEARVARGQLKAQGVSPG